MPARARLLGALILGLACAAVVGHVAIADTAADPSGDVLSCTGECSLYDQDLKSLSVDISGGNLVLTISQYGTGGNGPFTQAQKLYWPFVDIYTTSPDPTTPADLPDQESPNADYNVFVNCCTNGYQIDLIKEVGAQRQVIEPSVAYTNPDPNSVVYTIPLADIGNPSSVRARAWQGGTRDSGSHDVVDQVPDSGVVGSTGSGTPTDTSTTPTQTQPQTQTTTTPITTTPTPSSSFGTGSGVNVPGAALSPVKSSSVSFPFANSNSFPVNGSAALLAAGGLTAQAARTTTIGRATFTLPAGKTTTVKIKLSPKALKVIKKRGKLKAKLKATLRDPAGGVRTLTRNVTLKARGRLS